MMMHHVYEKISDLIMRIVMMKMICMLMMMMMTLSMSHHMRLFHISGLIKVLLQVTSLSNPNHPEKLCSSTCLSFIVGLTRLVQIETNDFSRGLDVSAIQPTRKSVLSDLLIIYC